MEGSLSLSALFGADKREAAFVCFWDKEGDGGIKNVERNKCILIEWGLYSEKVSGNIETSQSISLRQGSNQGKFIDTGGEVWRLPVAVTFPVYRCWSG